MELDQISKHVIYQMDFDEDNNKNGNIQMRSKTCISSFRIHT